MTTIPHGIDAYLDALASDNPLARALRGYADICTLHMHHDLMTFLAYDEETQVCERIYSTNPQTYPLGWRGQLGNTGWGDAVLRDGSVWHGENAAAIRAAFNDADRILASGFRSCLCIPARLNGKTLGAASFLGNHLRFDDAQLDKLKLFTALLIGPLMVRARRAST